MGNQQQRAEKCDSYDKGSGFLSFRRGLGRGRKECIKDSGIEKTFKVVCRFEGFVLARRQRHVKTGMGEAK